MNTQLVPSVSIDNLVNQRAAVVERLNSAISLIREASKIASAAHLGMPRLSISTSYSRHSNERDISACRIGTNRAGEPWDREESDRAEVDKLVRLGIDSAAWQYLMHESGLRSLMDATARAKWDKAISDGDIPELTKPNVLSTFTMLHDSRGEMFERGVIACFKSLAWCYKTNLPQKFGKRIVMQYLGGYGSIEKCDKLDDLIRVQAVLDGKPEPDHRGGVYSLLSGAGMMSSYPRRVGVAENEYVSIRTFKNGNGHVTFKRLDLIDKMNLIIAKHYPGALPAPK